MLIMLEYACLYLNKQSFEFARVLKVCAAVYSKRSLYKLLSSYRDRSLSKHCQAFKMKCFANRTNALAQAHNQKFFQGKKVSWH